MDKGRNTTPTVTISDSGRDWREIKDVQRTVKLTGFWKGSHKKIGRTENQPRDQICWHIHPKVRKCLKPLIRGERDPQLQSSWTFPHEKGRFLCLEEAKTSPWCANLAQQAGRKCWRLRCPWQCRKVCSQQEACRKTNTKKKTCWTHRQDCWIPKSKCHGKWPWKERMRGRASTGGPRRHSHCDRQHHRAQEQGGRAWPKGPSRSTDCSSKGQKSQTNNGQGKLMVYFHFYLPLWGQDTFSQCDT